MATDKRLDQVSNLTDFDYALIVKGTDVAKVTKQQLAELVGNLLYGATTKEALASVVAGQMKVRNFEAICIEVKSITYVQTIQTKLQNSVFGKYILKKTSGELSEVLFTKEVTNGLFSLGFESGLAVGSALLVIYGGA